MSFTNKKFNIVGEGTFGCVISPALPCDKTSNSIGRVGKLFHIKEESYHYTMELISQEIENMELINKIDKKSKWSVKYKSNCVIDFPVYKNFINNKKTPRMCTTLLDNYKNEYESVLQIIYKEKGEDLHMFMNNNHYKITDMIYGFINLAYGLTQLAKNKLIHGDIKTNNVIITTNKRMKIIDFGSIYTTNQNNYMSNNVLTHDNYFKPPEYSNYVQNTKNVHKKYTKVTNSLNNVGIPFEIRNKQYKRFKNDIKLLMNVANKFTRYKKGIESNYNISFLEKKFGNYRPKWTHLPTDKIDVFALGIIILVLMTHKNCSDKNTDSWSKLKEIVKKCVHFNPYERIDAKNLLIELKKI